MNKSLLSEIIKEALSIANVSDIFKIVLSDTRAYITRKDSSFIYFDISAQFEQERLIIYNWQFKCIIIYLADPDSIEKLGEEIKRAIYE